MSILKIRKQGDKQDWQKTGFYLNLNQGLLHYDVLPGFLFKDNGTILSLKAQKIKKSGDEIIVLSETDLSLALLTSEDGKIFKNESPNNFIEVGLYQYAIVTSLQAWESEPFQVTSFTEVIPDPLQATFNKTDESSLNANNGTITIVASDGVLPYSYSINNGLSYQASGNFFNLSPGTYDCIAKDAENTQVTQQLTITEFTIALSATFNKTDETQGGADDGTITIQGFNGAPPYEYSEDNGFSFQPSGFFDGLEPGVYDCICRDADLTEVTDQLTIAEGAVVPSFTASIEKNDSIQGSGIGGSIWFKEVYAPGVAPFEYSIDNGATFHSNAYFSDLSVGSYQAIVRDVNNDISSTYGISISNIDLGIVDVDNDFTSFSGVPGSSDNWRTEITVGSTVVISANGLTVNLANEAPVKLTLDDILSGFPEQTSPAYDMKFILEFGTVTNPENIGDQGLVVDIGGVSSRNEFDFPLDAVKTNGIILVDKFTDAATKDIFVHFRAPIGASSIELKRLRVYII